MTILLNSTYSGIDFNWQHWSHFALWSFTCTNIVFWARNLQRWLNAIWWPQSSSIFLSSRGVCKLRSRLTLAPFRLFMETIVLSCVVINMSSDNTSDVITRCWIDCFLFISQSTFGPRLKSDLSNNWVLMFTILLGQNFYVRFLFTKLLLCDVTPTLVKHRWWWKPNFSSKNWPFWHFVHLFCKSSFVKVCFGPRNVLKNAQHYAHCSRFWKGLLLGKVLQWSWIDYSKHSGKKMTALKIMQIT